MEGEEEREERRERTGREKERNGVERQGKEVESVIGEQRRMSEKEEEDNWWMRGRERSQEWWLGAWAPGVNYLGFPPGPPNCPCGFGTSPFSPV